MLIHVHLVLIPLLLALSAIFAASEASLFSLSRSQLETLKESRPNLYHSIRNLIYHPDAMLSTIIIGNECLNITIATIITSLLEFQLGVHDDRLLILFSVLLSSALLLTFSEILPKVIAFRMPILVASIVVHPMTWMHWVLTPLRRIFLFISSSLIRAIGLRVAPPSAINEQDFLTLVEVGAESGSLDRDEKEMIFNVFHFSDLTVSSIMTPWKDVFCLPEKLSVGETLVRIKKKAYSRIPIVSEDGHRVIGILYTKALLRLLLSPHPAEEIDAIKQALFPPYIVSTHKKIAKLFREFKLKKVHMALVVDEFGKHLGVVTLEDVLNALFQTQKKRGET